MFSVRTLKKAPPRPGVYLFKNSRGQTLYVGKAKNLRERLSYYLAPDLLEPKIRQMVRLSRKLDFTETVSEADALVLEADLIKRLKPHYNRLMKDDKSYQYLRVSQRLKVKSNPFDTARGHPERSRMDEKFEPSAALFPAVNLVRKKENDGADYFGPFPAGGALKVVLRLLRTIYPFRDCSNSKFKNHRGLGRGCFYFDLKLCGAPCVGRVTPAIDAKSTKILKSFFEGGSEILEKNLIKGMQQSSRRLDFEKALLFKEKLTQLEKIREVRFTPNDYLNQPHLAYQSAQNNLIDLIKFFNDRSSHKIVYRSGFRIEAYDISHLSGVSPTGSMVVFTNGRPDKGQYRRFKIKREKDRNDSASIREVIRRRLKHKEWPKADLILVDGGVGQLNSARKALSESGLPLIGLMALAKRLERPVIDGKYLFLKRNDTAILLLRAIRDEAHRFAKSYHKLLRSKQQITESKSTRI